MQMISDCNVNGYSSFEFPKLKKFTCIYQSGLVIGGKENGKVRVSGSVYRTGLKAGRINENGTFADPNSESSRVYRVRPDYKTADLTYEVESENKTKEEIRAQYEKDWNEWPANYGAPFNDVDKNGLYDPATDQPGVPGANQTLWFVANDLDSNQTKFFFGSLPLGIEMQVTVWGYNQQSFLDNVLFKKYKIINKSKTDIKETYIGIWSDPDLGNAGDDLVGCDTTLSLGYVYNSNPIDNSFNSNPPSAGFCLLQGPLVDGNADDVAYYNSKKIIGKKNLPMTAFSYVYKNIGWYGFDEPTQGNYEKGALRIYNYFKGINLDGIEHQDPSKIPGVTIEPGVSVEPVVITTKFPYYGDPVLKTGFIGNYLYPNGFIDVPKDRRLMVCSGPFNLSVSDTQEIIYAQIGAGGNEDVDYLGAVSLLKKYALSVKNLFYYSQPFASLENVKLNSSPLDKKVLLYWGEDENNINSIEKGNFLYKFQGYNIYQYPDIMFNENERKLISTIDIKDGIQTVYDSVFDKDLKDFTLKPVQYGTDSGNKYFAVIDKDYIKGEPLYNGTQYYYGVCHYELIDKPVINKTLENGINYTKVKPQSEIPGVRFEKNFGDILSVTKVGGKSDAEILPTVIVPSKLTGDEYELTFNNNGESTLFTLKNISTGEIKLANQSNLTGDDDYLITDGFILKVKDSSKNPLGEEDVYKFSSPKQVFNLQLAKEDVEKINVFPNPYYGVNPVETNLFEKVVTINHLPKMAVIRIFNLAGQLVRKIEKESEDTFVRWDLLNENQFSVASGMYIIHIEMPQLGKIKILKLAVIQDEIVPNSF